MHQNLVFSLICASTLFAASTLHAADPEVIFKVGDAVSTSLDECIEALENGAPMTFADEQMEGGKSVRVVMYDGHYFVFILSNPDELSRCRKLPLVEAE